MIIIHKDNKEVKRVKRNKKSHLTETTSTPRLARSCADFLVVSRVIPRILNSFESWVSARMASMTEPPWFPVAPKIVINLDMVDN